MRKLLKYLMCSKLYLAYRIRSLEKSIDNYETRQKSLLEQIHKEQDCNLNARMRMGNRYWRELNTDSYE